MAEIRFDDATFDAMKEVEAVLTKAVMPFREKIEAALIVFALVRMARVLVRVYPATVQKQLTPILIAYLQGSTKQPAGDPAALLWTPKDRRMD